ncbi:LuxR family transcriptional regulator [Jiella sp. MQZ9-1]|uniref:LuxR family transcriptional regulator n=1 Tax=Jiella flava TaxID=2816857 RepID=A0A939JVD3_9HYPH|nr:LuxR family transcriptional regulator [Jiella flava]MBO0661161.1 LuxR family transcriptional regulator [Jiella flava]MCD2469806.1 LuxR family transcriptional regulator [Jiella flava]
MSLIATDSSEIDAYFEAGQTAEERIALAEKAIAAYGLTSLIYDFTTIKYSHDGELVTPSFLAMRNLPKDMVKIWCEEGFYQIDPVQQLAFRSHLPFVWSYRRDGKTPLNRILGETHEPVVDYLHDSGITCGLTVPVHLPNGECATVTGIRHGAGSDFEREITPHVANFTLFAHILHEKVYAILGEDARNARPVHLTPRERECVAYAAEGLSAKEISLKIDRSVPTVVMHLNAATRKLAATNRAQMIARAAHYRLIETGFSVI